MDKRTEQWRTSCKCFHMQESPSSADEMMALIVPSFFYLSVSFQSHDCVVEVVESGPLMAKLKWKLKISQASTLVQEIELSACSHYLAFKCHVNWHENRKCLKVAFDTRLTTRVASFDSQFGYIERPTHTNTSWDSAKFEVCGHKYVCLKSVFLIYLNPVLCVLI